MESFIVKKNTIAVFSISFQIKELQLATGAMDMETSFNWTRKCLSILMILDHHKIVFVARQNVSANTYYVSIQIGRVIRKQVDIFQCKLVINIKKWFDINEYK